MSRWAGRKISLKITNNSVFEQQEPITWKVYFDEVTEVIVLKYLELKMKITTFNKFYINFNPYLHAPYCSKSYS